MAKKKVTAKKSAPKTKKRVYKAETYGIQFDSMTFLVFSVFVLVVAAVIVSRMMGLRIF